MGNYQALGRRKLRAEVVPCSRLPAQTQARLYQLYEAHYEDVSWQRFQGDLLAKDEVILLIDRNTQTVQGFSTLKFLHIPHEGRVLHGVFSGDTVLDPAYRGQRVLGAAFLRRLWRARLQHPFSPLDWFLISKGYKTYLLMANGFTEHYPRYERPAQPRLKARLDVFARALFGSSYDVERGLVLPGPGSGKLKREVAPVDVALLDQLPRVRFFVERNPDWSEGVELACLARMEWTTPLKYQLVSLFRRLRPPAPKLSIGSERRTSSRSGT